MKSLICLFLCLVSFAVFAAPETVLTLSPSEGNPRNSEGDFIHLDGGKILFIYSKFSGGGSDHDTAELASRASTDGGRTWSGKDEIVVPNEGGWNVMSVSLLRLADGRIALFYLRKNSLTDCRPVVRFSTDEAKTWSEPVQIVPDEDTGYYVMNNDRVIQLNDGRLVAPVALHNKPGWEEPDWKGVVGCYLSDDSGKTWHRSRSMLKTFATEEKRLVTQEPGVVELADGKLLMFTRTDAGEQYRSFSQDRGETWSPFEPMGVPSPVSPSTIERIPSTGDLLLVWNDHSDLPVKERRARTPFHAAISKDEGKTWQNTHVIDGDPEGWFCYTAMAFAGDYVLLGHVAGSQKSGGKLSTTRITRFPVSWLYE